MEKFQKAKSMIFPRQVLVGHNVIERAGELCRDLELDGSCLIVTGRTTNQIAGQLVKGILEKEDYKVFVLEVGESCRENIDKVKQTAEGLAVNFLLGVGGGSKIDILKVASKELKKPFISIPTSASHDGIASPRASLKGEHGSISVEASTPLGILADTAVIVRAPYRTLAAGCADVISNLTAVKDWILAHRLKNESISSAACALAKMSACAVIDNVNLIQKGDEESVWFAIKPIVESGAAMCIADSSRPCSGSEHSFSHALDFLAPGKALHGEQCGIGAMMMMYLHNGDWEEIRRALKELHAPVTAKELGIDKELIIQALTMAHKIRPERYTILGDVGLSVEAAEKVCRTTGVI